MNTSKIDGIKRRECVRLMNHDEALDDYRSIKGLPPYDKSSYTYLDAYAGSAFQAKYGLTVGEFERLLKKIARKKEVVK